ncbi:bifunctional phosphopantothenoylcysteine decarboxylase/phosphopantothenate--cysteine ligase CoaBC [Halocatena pleomorpha]|uniref:Coenzyme A biosynthesis bifunctional protein CoaBC n=1 Tax=Halocatena pleomorpha TaxID=1785090 RepID=A0A3P3RJ41_9EURY|nr:bifunctional phosphopantothenoylcysteine decarboxylase/phosphopantothenate--cysteine ligase CoaBC [Halocatena pleomorpha]RRJ32830.1 bifunctional phosphopantothenoylcysteine decarboxylase/phosphopantothenate--cysteine ligase CoaBC [Halocatena pleomorpha]
MLEGVNVALCVTGSIAAVRTVELAHELRRCGATVRTVMTESAQGIIHPWALEFATDHAVVTEITGSVEHVELCGHDGWADVVLIAPTTANTIGKIAAAIDDTPVTTCVTTALGTDIPIVVAPAMHQPMYDHPGVLEAIERIESWGVTFVAPRIEEGKAKIAADDSIVLSLAKQTGADPLAGKHIVVTSGATTERIDPVRTITNRASGRTGRAIARACYVRGGNVTLVHDGDDVSYAAVEHVESADEMIDAVERHVPMADALVSAAAISDYTTETRSEKVRSGQQLTIDLEPTPKLIDTVRDAHPELPIVGFKLESGGNDDDLIDAARGPLNRADLSFVVANDTTVLGERQTRALLVGPNDHTEYVGSKTGLGLTVVDRLVAELR